MTVPLPRNLMWRAKAESSSVHVDEDVRAVSRSRKGCFWTLVKALMEMREWRVLQEKLEEMGEGFREKRS